MRSLVAIVLVASCGAPGAPVRDDDADPDLRALPPDVLARPAIAYSGYRAGQSPDVQIYPSEEEVEADLRLLLRGGWRWIRLFDAGPHAERVLRVIDRADLDLVVLLGAWITGADDTRADLERAAALAAQYPDLVVAVSVGNETLDDWSNVRVSPAAMVEHIQWMRERVTVPVTTDDSWYPFTFGRDGATDYADVALVAAAVDLLAIHVYAFADAPYGAWDWKQEGVPEAARARAMMDASIDYSRGAVAQVRSALAARGLERPIVIGEIGWKSAPGADEAEIEPYLAHPVNQQMFRERLRAWVEPEALPVFWFEGFDEPWKGEWGDDGWGLLDVDRRPKLAVRDLYPELVPDDAPAYSEADAVYYRPRP
jgi:exo-beta-1,3-glucanase (GH17 family)